MEIRVECEFHRVGGRGCGCDRHRSDFLRGKGHCERVGGGQKTKQIPGKRMSGTNERRQLLEGKET